MNKFCEEKVITCPTDMLYCNRLISVDKDGDECRDWAKDNPKEANSVKQKYCIKHNTNDCLCINRIKNQLYKKIQPKDYVNDSCWFIPCQYDQKYLVLSDDTFKAENRNNPTICPNKICEKVT